jgi:hypothetical protein
VKRAARCDLNVETGVDFAKAFQLWVPDLPAPFSTVQANQRVWFEGFPHVVYSATTSTQSDGLEYTDIVFDKGLWYEPTARALSTDLLVPAKMVEILAAQAAMTILGPVPEEFVLPIEDGRLTIPVTISPNTTVTVTMDVEFTNDLAELDAYGPHSWDLYVETAQWGRMRLVQGTLSVLVGDAS